MSVDGELDHLIALVLEVYGESALDLAVMRALARVPYAPLDTSLRSMLPAVQRRRAVVVDSAVLQDELTSELRRLIRPQ